MYSVCVKLNGKLAKNYTSICTSYDYNGIKYDYMSFFLCHHYLSCHQGQQLRNTH